MNHEIFQELERLLSSREFANSERMSRFLRHAVERTLQGDREGLKESVIGSEVFDRAPGYDPKVDPVVRNEARRLRAKLDECYARTPPPMVRISIPKGGYVAAFEPVAATEPVAALPVAVIPALVPKRTARGKWIAWGCGLAIASCLIAGSTLFNAKRPHGLPVLSTVTSYPGRQGHPALSPDASEVAFTWSGEKPGPARIYIAKVNGGEPRALTAEGSGDSFPAWSPDGARIAFIRYGKLIVARVSGGEERTLTKAFTSSITWSLDGKSILFSDWIVSNTVVALFSADVLTGARRQLTYPVAASSSGSSDAAPALSPDGTRVAFTRCAVGSCDVWMIPASGGAERQVTHEKTNFFGVTWSPDGQTLVFSSRLLGPAQLWQIPASGSGKPELIPVAGEDATFPRFGARPGGPARLVYEQHISDSNIWRVPVEISGAGPVRTKGEPMRVIASTRLDDSPQVSPDGRKVAFVSNRSGFDEVWTVGVDGTNTSVVTQMRTSSLGSPRWSADSSRLAFDAVSSAGRAVFLVDAAGGTPRQWTPWGTASRPSWSRDGRWLYYGEKDDKGRLNVWRASTVDQNQRQMWIPDAFEPFEAPDGTLYFERNDQIYRAAAGGSPASAVKLLIGLPTVHGWWGLGAGGIFFVDVISPPVYSVPPVSRGDKPVYFFDPRTGARRQIGIIGGDLVGYLPNFAVSPDGSSIYYSVLEVAVSQIRMIEGIW